MLNKNHITKDKIKKEAFNIVKEKGIIGISTRELAKRLECSTQPILYYYKSIEAIKRDVISTIKEYFLNYVLEKSDSLIELRFLKFCYEKNNLFNALTQNNDFSENILKEYPFEEIISRIQVLDMKNYKANRIYTLFGLAFLLSNKKIAYNEKSLMKILNSEQSQI